jgi:hypothetical protein
MPPSTRRARARLDPFGNRTPRWRGPGGWKGCPDPRCVRRAGGRRRGDAGAASPSANIGGRKRKKESVEAIEKRGEKETNRLAISVPKLSVKKVMARDW